MTLRQLYIDTNDAWTSLKRRPLRSLLSSLGIGIGVTALVAMLSISEGAKRKTLAKIISLGTNTLRIEDSREQLHIANSSAINLSQGLIPEDSVALGSWLKNSAAIGAYCRKDNVIITSDSRSAAGTVMAVSSPWYGAERLAFNWGRPHSIDDEKQHRTVCVVGSSLSKKLQLKKFQTIRIENFNVQVIGQLAPRGHLLTEGTGLSSLDFDNTIILPLPVSPFNREISGKTLLDGIVVSLHRKDESHIFQTAGQVEKILTTNHRGVKDFRIVVPLALLREARENQKIFALIMGSIAGLSLLVGGIGVMNVMLANISEQTREIGLRMAVGATRARIIHLFLWNAMLLTGAGGLWGAVGGIALSIAIQTYAGWEIAFSSMGILIGPLSALLTGLVFGLHPAIRAASLNPAIALRDS